jgi:hypothetical protein
MNSEHQNRDEALRRLLVATVDSGPAPARPRWRVAAASIGAFAVAGALTGGTLATVGASPADSSLFDVPIEISTPPILEDDVRILGTPIYVTGREPTLVDLGLAPEGANGLAVAIYCLEVGSYRVALDGRFELGMECTPESGPSTGGGGGVVPFADGPPRELSVDLDSGGYAVWAAWVDRPADAEPSAAQLEALADGVVSREEYLAGFDRYVACMAALGFEVFVGNREKEIIGYSIPGTAGDSGAANRCYEAEFHLVDAEWQVAHED